LVFGIWYSIFGIRYSVFGIRRLMGFIEKPV
jgi:hypothetical protein